MNPHSLETSKMKCPSLRTSGWNGKACHLNMMIQKFGHVPRVLELELSSKPARVVMPSSPGDHDWIFITAHSSRVEKPALTYAEGVADLLLPVNLTTAAADWATATTAATAIAFLFESTQSAYTEGESGYPYRALPLSLVCLVWSVFLCYLTKLHLRFTDLSRQADVEARDGAGESVFFRPRSLWNHLDVLFIFQYRKTASGFEYWTWGRIFRSKRKREIEMREVVEYQECPTSFQKPFEL